MTRGRAADVMFEAATGRPANSTLARFAALRSYGQRYKRDTCRDHQMGMVVP